MLPLLLAAAALAPTLKARALILDTAARYSVVIQAPESVSLGQSFSFSVSGFSSTTSVLAVLLDARPCAASAAAEAGTHRFSERDYRVRGSFGPYTLQVSAGKRRGRQYVCAYLLRSAKRPLVTRAHAAVGYGITEPATWRVRHVTDALLDGLSCASASLCVAYGFYGALAVTTDPAEGPSARWATTTLDGESLNGLSCPTASLCVAVDESGNVLTSTDPGRGAGAHWAVESVASFLFGMSCPTSSLCVSSDARHSIVTSTDPGDGSSARWTTRDVDSGAGDATIDGLSCASASVCVAVDEAGNVLVSTDPARGAAATWSVKHVDQSPLRWISCAASLCAALDLAGNVVSSSDPARGASATWSLANVSPSELWAVSCASAHLCVATDGNRSVATSTDPGAGASATWTLRAVEPLTSEGGEPGLGAISCPSPTLCAAIDGSGNALVSTDPGGG